MPSEFTLKGKGEGMIARIWKYFPTVGVMLVSVEDNGFRAYAPFQTHNLLALLQLEELPFEELDLSVPPIDNTEPPL